MELPSDVHSTTMPDSFARLELNNAKDVASAPTEHLSVNSSPTVDLADHPNQVGFLTLPREIRDQIYLNLVVAAHPIQYDEHFETLSRSHTFAHRALMWMFEVASNTQIAQEAREAFYERNTFLIYTHDIPALFGAESHQMVFGAAEGIHQLIESTAFNAGAWVRKLAVRVGWHSSSGWLPDQCCQTPARDLSTLLESDGLQSVIIDARFGAWPYGYPQGIGWDLLRLMKGRWEKDFKIYNDQGLGSDTRRYTSGRRDLTDGWPVGDDESGQEAEESEAGASDGEPARAEDDEEVERWGEAESEGEE